MALFGFEYCSAVIGGSNGMQRNGQLSGCGLFVVLVVAALVIQYVGAIIGIGLIVAAIYLRRSGVWHDHTGRLKANIMVGVGIALGIAQAAMLYDHYRDAHPAREPNILVGDGPIPERFWGNWASDLRSCDDFYSRMNIDSDRVAMSSVSIFAHKVSTLDANTLIISGSAAGSGGGDVVLQDETQRLTLSNGGNTLTMGEYVNVRCPS